MDSLSSRYQAQENMKTSKTMFIATMIYIISSTINLSGLLALKYSSIAELLTFAVCKVNIGNVYQI